MPKTSTIRLLAAPILLLALAPGLAGMNTRQDDPTPDELISRAEKALGGPRATQRIASYHAIGTIESPVGAVKTELFWARSGGALVKHAAEGMGETVAGTNGSIGWRIHAVGAKILDKDQIADVRRQSAPHIEFFEMRKMIERRYAIVERAGERTIDGRRCYVVRVVGTPREDGTAAEEGEILFDAESGLPTAMIVTGTQKGKPTTTTARLSDWVEIDGAKFFRKMTVTTAAAPGTAMTYAFETIELNSVDPSVFQPPPQVVAQLRTETSDDDEQPVTLEDLTPQQRKLAESMIEAFGRLPADHLGSTRTQLIAQRSRLPETSRPAFTYVLQWLDERIGDG